MPVTKADLLAQLPAEWPTPLLPEIQAQIGADDRLIVLDDDPTGTQTVHDVPVLTEWSEATLTAELERPGAVIYILTNSRSMPAPQAEAINAEIATHLRAAASATNRQVAVVSRSDSTLRGHYPAETRALEQTLGRTVDAVLLIPFFLEGGRYTIDDVHYVEEGAWMTPAAQTEFARDATFGYRNSNLRQWAIEKHGGSLSQEDVCSISLGEIRSGGPDAVQERLDALAPGQVCAINAASYRDLEVLVAGLLASEARGRHYLYRTAASFVRVRCGLSPAPLLTSDALGAADGQSGGLIVVGSYVNRTTEQIEAAAQRDHVTSIEVSVRALLGSAAREEIGRVQQAAQEAIAAGRDALVYTSRERVTAGNKDATLDIGQTISQGLVSIVAGLEERPAWVIAKGGITSSDVATCGLGVRRAWVMGQAIPGVPIWRLGPESRWPDLVYVVFPGNVGGPDAVADMAGVLRGESDDAQRRL